MSTKDNGRYLCSMSDKVLLPIYDLRTLEDGTGMYVCIDRNILVDRDIVAPCDEPRKVSELLQLAFDASSLIEEHVWLVCLDNALKVVGLFEIAHGTPNSAIISPTNVYRRILFTNATKIIIAHNHTSGSLTPSSVDETLTENIVRAGKIVDIPLKDHIILGKNGEFVSMRERNIKLFDERNLL